jgi:transposase
MEARELKGLEIAARMRIIRQGSVWLVPSQSGKGRYVVDPREPSCTCEDFYVNQPAACKHIVAVRYVTERKGLKKLLAAEVEQQQLPFRKTYPQHWAAYERAQQSEKDRFKELLHDLCRGIEEPAPALTGRPRVPLADAVFASCFKVWSGLSSRRFNCDLQDAHKAGYLSRPIHCHKISAFLENPELTTVLHQLIAESSRPLAEVETDFAVDSTGFATSRFAKWHDKKYGVTRDEAEWVKAHAMVGVKTNVVTAVVILDQDAADSPQFPALVKATAQGFKIAEVSADKAYAGTPNFEAVEDCGGAFFPVFRKNTTGAVGGLFEKAFHLFCLHREEYLKHYHKRSNVESTFSAIKRKFGDSVRSKTDTAMRNEVLAKCLCFNISMLIHEQEELGIVVDFGNDGTDEAPSVLRFPPRG